MGINKAFATANVEVMWDGQVAATVRGINTTDITNVLIAEGQNIYALFESFDELRATPGVDLKDTDAVAGMLMAKAPALLMSIGKSAPTLIARLIVVASDDDDPEAAMESVLKFPLPLQVDVLSKIAEQTFVGPEGFRVFLGNVQALVAAFAGMTNADRQAALGMEPSGSEIGAPQSTN